MSEDENGAGGPSGPVAGPPYSGGGVGARTGHYGAAGAHLGPYLAGLWAQQQAFNEALAQLEGGEGRSREEMAQVYILGIMSELDELLRRLNWKYHRRQEKPEIDPADVGDDLADLTKYTWCLWQLFGFEPEDMLGFVDTKTEALWTVLETEFRKPEDYQPVLFVDLDETVARYREGFTEWMVERGLSTKMPAERWADYSLAGLYDIEEEDYQWYKAIWERSGGYGKLRPYDGWIQAVRAIREEEGAFLVVNTARPASEKKRVWYDCYAWATKHLGPIDRIAFTNEGRIARMREWKEKGHPVLAFEDSPGVLYDLSKLGIPVLAHEQPYNRSIRVLSEGNRGIGFAGDEPVGLVTAGRKFIREQR